MTEKALAAAAAAAVALLAAGSAQPRGDVRSKSTALLGVVSDASDPARQSLVRLDGRTLRPLPGARLELGSPTYSWAFSPDRSLLAFARVDGTPTNLADVNSFVRLVDPQELRIVDDFPIGSGSVSSIAWLAPDRLVALVWRCCSAQRELVVVDPVARTVVERRALPGEMLGLAKGYGRLVVLVATQAGIAPVELFVIEADGTIRSIVLDRIDGGSERLTGSDLGVDVLRPALAVQRDGQRGFVLAKSGEVADVDLASMTVTYHSLSFGRRAPASQAKRYQGSTRYAEVLGNGLVAISGADTRPFLDKHGKELIRHRPTGLELVDTRAWTARTIDRDADSFSVAGGTLLATGSRWTTASVLHTGTGLAAYTLDGRRRFRLFKKQEVWIGQVYGTRAFVSLTQGYEPSVYRVVDLGQGRVAGKRRQETLPWLIAPEGLPAPR
jgi:hypothetical protein